MKSQILRVSGSLFAVFTFLVSVHSANVAQNAGTFAGAGYLRSAMITRPAFSSAAFTYELWFKADGPGVLINEVDQFSPSLWDYSFLEVRNDRMLLAGVPGVETIAGGFIDYGQWYHAAIRYSPVTSELDLFLNGVKVGSGMGTRALPWQANRTTFMAVGRGGPVNLATLAGAQFTLAETSGNSSIALSQTGDGYLLARSGDGLETGTYTTTNNLTSRTWDVTLSPTGGGTATSLRLSFTNATHGQFTLTRAGSAQSSGLFTSAADIGVGASFKGQVDEVRMWKEALTDDAIVNNRRIKLATGDPRLFAMWSLDVIQGSAEGYPTTPDRSGSNNPALIVRAVTFTPSGADLIDSGAPLAITGSATVGPATVTLDGTFTSSVAGGAYFRFGKNGALDETTTPIPIAASTNAPIEATLQGLLSQANYSYQVVVTNQFGLTEGAVRTFFAPDLRPFATTGNALDSAGTSTILIGEANTPIPGVAHFIWGETQLTNQTPDIPVLVGTSEVRFTVENLVGGHIYRYALVVSNQAGLSAGTTVSFTKIAPNVADKAATFAGNGYLRSQYNTEQFFHDAAFTYELWFKAEAAGALINEVHQFTESLWDYNFLEVDAEGRLIAAVPGVLPITGPAVEFGTWHHTAIRYNPATSELDLFLDGNKVATGEGTRRLPWNAGYTVFMTFGRSAPGHPWLRGQVDEVRMWKTVLTEDEIAGNRRVKFSTGDSRLFAMWSLDVIQGSSEGYPTTPDRSGNNNPALLVRAVTLSASGADLVGDQRPTATTGGVQDSPGTSTILTGTATTPIPGVAYFIWGENDLDHRTRSLTLPSSTSSVQITLNNLIGNFNYRYALVVSNEAGLRVGATRTFTKIAAPVAARAATFAGRGYLRSQFNTQEFFHDAAFTYELWFEADAAGALINEVHQFSEPLWDYNFMEVDPQSRLIAAVPGVPAITGPAVGFGTWHHAAVRYDPAKSDLDLFLDGTKVGTSHGTRLLPWNAGDTVFMTFGRGASGRPWLTGQIDEVRMWKSVLTDEQIAANRRVKFASDNGQLFAMWSLDAITGSSEGYPTTPDRSSNKNPALLVGSVTLTDSGADLIKPIAAGQDGALVLRFAGVPTRQLRLRSTTDFVSWTDGPVVVVDALGIATFQIDRSSSEPFRFYSAQSP